MWLVLNMHEVVTQIQVAAEASGEELGWELGGNPQALQLGPVRSPGVSVG